MTNFRKVISFGNNFEQITLHLENGNTTRKASIFMKIDSKRLFFNQVKSAQKSFSHRSWLSGFKLFS